MSTATVVSLDDLLTIVNRMSGVTRDSDLLYRPVIGDNQKPLFISSLYPGVVLSDESSDSDVD